MTSKNRQPGIGQDTLFSLADLDPTEISQDGISVDRAVRAKHILGALDLLGESRKMSGFTSASQNEPNNIHRHKIVRRYGASKTDAMRSSTAQKEHDQYNQAKWQFAYATGWMALKGAGIVADSEIEQQLREEFRQFENTYFGTKTATNNRNRFKRKLIKDLE